VAQLTPPSPEVGAAAQARWSMCLQVPAAQLSTVQVDPSSQVTPQAPQLGIWSVGASHPSETTPLQLPNPALHEAMAHAPPTHAGTAFAKPQEASLPGSSILPSQLLSMPSQISGGAVTLTL